MLNISGENYLKAIYILTKNGQKVHAVDIAEYLNFSKPSVSRAIKSLVEEGHIEVDDHKNISLTFSGNMIAESVFLRYNYFENLLIEAGVEPLQARKDADRLEHAIDGLSFCSLEKYLCKMSMCE